MDYQAILAIVETLNQWRHYLKGSNLKLLMQCDLENVESLQMSNVLCQRQT